MSELEHLLNKKADLDAEIENEKHRAECKEIAKTLFTAYSAFYAAGFTQEQAWYFTKELFDQTIRELFESL